MLHTQQFCMILTAHKQKYDKAEQQGEYNLFQLSHKMHVTDAITSGRLISLHLVLQ